MSLNCCYVVRGDDIIMYWGLFECGVVGGDDNRCGSTSMMLFIVRFLFLDRVGVIR